MSDAVINLNPDLKRLQNEGYELEVHDGCAIIRNVPYLDADGTIQRGILVSPLNMRGDTVKYNNDHVILFQGTYPHRKSGDRMEALFHSKAEKTIAGISVNMQFSNKPVGGYKDYYEKFTRYIEILSSEAKAVDPNVTAATFKKIVSSDDSVFNYADTNALRADVTDINDKVNGCKIGIIGLGGTGSYILDQVAKTPVAEIHLYDGDLYCQHNAFRAPGATAKEVFEKQPYKVEYFKEIYCNMHRKIFSYPYQIDEDNVEELRDLDFVFLAMDSGNSKQIIVNFLREQCISFIDTGIDINRVDNSLIGMARVTQSINGDTVTADENISYNEVEEDLYQSNVQTADMNAICAIVAVIQWKKQFGFYKDDINKENCIYTTNNGEFAWS